MVNSKREQLLGSPSRVFGEGQEQPGCDLCVVDAEPVELSAWDPGAIDSVIVVDVQIDVQPAADPGVES